MKAYLENVYVYKELYALMFDSICQDYDLTLTELIVLMYLNQNFESAKEIVQRLKIAKSYVSSSVRHLEEKGYIQKLYYDNDHRTIHLKLSDSSKVIIEEIERLLNELEEVLLHDFNKQEREGLKEFVLRINANMHDYIIKNRGDKK